MCSLILLLAFWCHVCYASLKTLGEGVYLSELDAVPCVGFSNVTHTFGCYGPRDGSIFLISPRSNTGSAGVLYLASQQAELDELLSSSSFQSDRWVVILPPTLFSVANLRSLSNLAQSRIAGVILVAIANKTMVEDKGLTLFSGSEFEAAAYSDEAPSPWNPNGRGLLNERYDVAIFAISERLSNLHSALLLNREKSYRNYPLMKASIDAFMYASTNAETCLRRSSQYSSPRRFCYPVNEDSYWATPSSIEALSPQRPLVWLSARLDPRALFPDMNYGVESTIPAIVTLLAVADTLGKLDVGNARVTKADIVYSFMDGEGWDFLGSKMLAQDLKSFECKVQDDDKPNRCRNPPRSSTRFTKLGLDRIIAFLDLGQLATTGNGTQSVYGHLGAKSTANRKLISLLTGNAPSDIAFGEANAAEASASLPPSAAQSFVDARSTLPHVHVANHEGAYNNPYYGSILDRGVKLRNQSAGVTATLCGVANMLSKSAYQLAVSGDADGASGVTVPGNATANCTLVASLWDCLAYNFSCPLIGNFLNCNIITLLNIYGAGTEEYQLGQLPYSSGYMKLFLPRYLGSKTATNISSTACEVDKDCEGDMNWCIQGKCTTTSLTYHDAYGTGLRYDPSAKWFSIEDASKSTWTQSLFGLMQVRLFMGDYPEQQAGEIAGSAIWTVLCGALFWALNKRFQQFIKP